MKFLIEVEIVDGDCMDCDLGYIICDKVAIPCPPPKKRYEVTNIEEIKDNA